MSSVVPRHHSRAESFEARTATDPYPSRVGREARFLERLDPIVHDRERALRSGPLRPEQVEQYERDGFLFFPEYFSREEIATFHAELERLRCDETLQGRPELILEPESRDFRSLFRVHETNELFARLGRDPRLADVAGQLLGSEVYVHQSRVNYKPGFRGREFYWHSDFETWHVEDGMPRMRALSFSISLTPNYPENGPVMVIPGSHRRFLTCVGETPEEHYKRSLRKQVLGVPDDESLARMIEENGIRSLTGPAGSVLLFDCNLMHGSGSNITPWPRSNVFFVFNSIENELDEPFCGLAPRPDFIAKREPPRRLTARPRNRPGHRPGSRPRGFREGPR